MPAETNVFCITCDISPKWANHAQCAGCLYYGVKPCDVVPKLATHTDLSVAMAEVRRYVAQWEQEHPRWQLEPSYQRIWEDSAAPSRYADRSTSIGRKLVWARFTVERRHPRGRRPQWWARLPVSWDEAYGLLTRYGCYTIEVPQDATPISVGLT